MHNTFLVNREAYQTTKWAAQPLPSHLVEGEVLLRIDTFSFTANNITYAMIGDKFGYWQFFPAEVGWGVVPVWGFAEVVASQQAQVAVGERFYGYYPMSTHLVVQPNKVTTAGFLDASAHRLSLPIVYNYYSNTATDRMYAPDQEDLISLFRPLFLTSFLLDDFFADNRFFGAKNIILTGASSKTALGLAYLLYLRQRAKGDEFLQTTGLTSARNLDFVEGLGLYDHVLTYDQVATLPTNGQYAIVDFAGDQPLQSALQQHLGATLRYNCAVGMTHWDQNAPQSPVEGSIKPILFFAPTHAQRRGQDWGEQGFQAKVGHAWHQFVGHAAQWLTIQHATGPAAIAAMYADTLAGRTDPRTGQVASMVEKLPAV